MKVTLLAEVLETDPHTLLGWSRSDGEKLLEFVRNNRWSELEQLQMINYGKFLLSQRGDEK